MDTPEKIAEVASRADTRPVYVYDLPASLRPYANGVTAYGLVELNAEEELMATKRARGDAVRLAFELSRESLRTVLKGTVATRVNCGDGSTDAEFLKMHPKVRALVMTAYADLHNPSQADANSFLQSRRVVAG
jgi:hypothetical protein